MQETRETQVQSLGQEDPLEEGMAAHSSILAWRILIGRGAWQGTVQRVAESRSQLKQLGTAHKDLLLLWPKKLNTVTV